MLGSRNPSHKSGGPDLERHLFWRGQLLGSRDLNDVGAGEEERLFWHNRAVHDAYGVAVGLRVDPGTGELPEVTEVTVHPGLAYDAYGRELALSAETPVPPPRDADRETDQAWALLLRYRESAGCGCGGGTEGPRSELVWRRARSVSLKDGVVLARGWWISGIAGWLFRPDPDFYPLRARPFSRPHLGHGETLQGGTAWRPWSLPPDPPVIDFSGSPLPGITIPAAARGIEVTIDTSAAGFSRTPCYFAWLQGGLWQVPHRLVRTAPIERITAASRNGFTFSLWDPAASTTAPSVTNQAGQALPFAIQSALLNLARQRLYVCWLGIQMDPTGLHGPLALTALQLKVKTR